MGSIQKRPDRPKPWRARYRGPDGREHSRSFARRVDADRWLRLELASADRGLWVDPTAGDVVFGDWAEAWFTGLTVKPKTAAGYRSLLESRVLPTFGTVPLRRISPAMVRAWVAEMADEGLSASRQRQARQVLRAALDQAVTDGLIGRNPTDKVKVAAPTPLPSELVFRLRQHRAELVEFLHSDFEPWMLREWRRLSTPEWRDILVKSIKAQDSIRESYARWMPREVLLDPEYHEPTR